MAALVAAGGRVLAEVALPLGGLMSAEPVETLRLQVEAAVNTARALGSPLHDPFMMMSFLALEVIPSLKLTDKGLVDVDRFALVPLWIDQRATSAHSTPNIRWTMLPEGS